jgi:hypothetical protein
MVAGPTPRFLAWMIAGHVILALATRAADSLALLYCLVSLGTCAVVALRCRRPAQVAACAAYLTGAEVLWRMTGGAVTWEVAKLVTIAVMLAGTMRFVRRPRRSAVVLLYLLLLLPSAVITLLDESPDRARQLLSANLAGPVALALCVLFFSQMASSPEALRRVLWWMIGPVVSIAVIAALGILGAADISFAQSSNSIASGGFGPNQVSAALSLGALSCLAIAFLAIGRERFLAVLLILPFLLLSVLTFSRGGLANFAIPAVLVGIRSLGRLRSVFALLAGALLVFIVVSGVVVPRLDRITKGQFEERYGDIDIGSRSEFARGDLDIWSQNRLVGVGPGVSSEIRGTEGQPFAAHTEYTRLLAEHGILGLGALACMAALVATSFIRAGSPKGRALVLLCAGWALVEMAHSATRLVAVAFVFGLMRCRLQPAGGRSPTMLAWEPLASSPPSPREIGVETASGRRVRTWPLTGNERRRRPSGWRAVRVDRS